MKVHNAVIGMEVQVKHDCRGYADEFIEEGLVCNVSRIDYISDAYELRLEHPDIDKGFAWVNASDVRRYKEEVPEVQVPEEPQEVIQVGDSVLVGAEGAGYGCMVREYAGLTCAVVDTSFHTDCMMIAHPDVMWGQSYTSRKKYLTKVIPKPVRTDLSSLRVGDYIVANGTDPHLQEGVAYRVVQEGATFPLIALHHSENADWREGYCVISRNVAKILREVNDATPRVVKSRTESTFWSE